MKGGGRGGGHSRASGGERSRSQTQHRRRQLCTFCQPSIRSRRGPCRNRIGIGIESSRYHHTKPKRPPPPARDVSDPRSRCLRDVCQGEREGGKGRKRIFAILRISLPFFCASAADSRKRRTFQPSSSGFFLLSSTVCILKAEAMPSSYVWTKKNCFRQHCVQPPLSVFRFYGNKVSLHSRRFSFLKGTSVW